MSVERAIDGVLARLSDAQVEALAAACGGRPRPHGSLTHVVAGAAPGAHDAIGVLATAWSVEDALTGDGVALALRIGLRGRRDAHARRSRPVWTACVRARGSCTPGVDVGSADAGCIVIWLVLTPPDDPEPSEQPAIDPAALDAPQPAPGLPQQPGVATPQVIPPEVLQQVLAAQQQQPPSAPAPLPAPSPPNRATHQDRAALIEALRKLRKSDVLITYVTSTRPGIQAHMALDAVRRIYEHLPTARIPKLDLFIISNGGDGVAPWRLMTLLREVADEVNVLVPANAFSAATLAALGADNVVMHPMGTLGPIDPTVADPFSADPQTGQPRPVSVEDVAAYVSLVKDDVGIRHEDELVQAFALLAKEFIRSRLAMLSAELRRPGCWGRSCFAFVTPTWTSTRWTSCSTT